MGYNDSSGDRYDYYYKDNIIYEKESFTNKTTDTGTLPDTSQNTAAGTISC